MAGNTFGKVFQVTTFGESHGRAMGLIVDGCPPGLPLEETVIQEELDKRKPGQMKYSSSRKEPDQVQILSGAMDGITTGSPIGMAVFNRDAKSEAYDPIKSLFRPGHADITYFKKYGLRDHRGGGRSSARETVSRVAAGVVAQAVLDQYGVQVEAYTVELAGVKVNRIDLGEVENNEFRSPDPDAVPEMSSSLDRVREAGDSAGGIVEVLVRNCPAGLGEPVFDKLDAELAKAIMSIGAVKAVEIGAGIEAARLMGSENNDPILPEGLVLQDHDKSTRDNAETRQGLHDLESGPEHVACGIPCPGHLPVSVTRLDHQDAQVKRVLDKHGRFLHGHALFLPDIEKQPGILLLLLV